MFTDEYPSPCEPFDMPLNCKIILPVSQKKDNLWFECEDFDHIDHEDIEENLNRITELMKAEIEILGDSTKLFLGGFNLGVTIASAVWLYYNEGPLGGLFGVAGCICTDLQYDKIDVEMKQKTPVMFFNGDEDWHIKELTARTSFNFLSWMGIEHYEYIMEPGVSRTYSEPGIYHIDRWTEELIPELKERFEKQRPS
jgi:predicted esterase